MENDIFAERVKEQPSSTRVAARTTRAIAADVRAVRARTRAAESAARRRSSRQSRRQLRRARRRGALRAHRARTGATATTSRSCTSRPARRSTRKRSATSCAPTSRPSVVPRLLLQGLHRQGWYYPYHYGPLVADVAGRAPSPHRWAARRARGRVQGFELGKPFQPFEQLMGALPSASAKLLPRPYRRLMNAAGAGAVGGLAHRRLPDGLRRRHERQAQPMGG